MKSVILGLVMLTSMFVSSADAGHIRYRRAIRQVPVQRKVVRAVRYPVKSVRTVVRCVGGMCQ